MAEKNTGVEIKVRAELLGITEDDKRPQVWAYAFTSDGDLLDRRALDASGKGTLRLPASRRAQAIRVVVGPEPGGEKVHLPDIVRRGALEKHVRVELDKALPESVFQFPPHRWECFFGRLCFVPGTLYHRIKWAGGDVDYPVCDATVEVYEVDPLPILVPKIPDDVLDRLRHIVLEQPHVGPHGPGPDPGPLLPQLGPEPDPGPLLPRLERQPGRFARDVVPLAANAETRMPAFPADLQLAASLGNRFAFERALIANAGITRLILCSFHGLPFFTKRLVATATTDECGHFCAVILRPCNDTDTPDLYFKATQDWFGGLFTRTIYEPLPFWCHTHWNYVCGTEVTLVTTDPLARACNRCPVVNAQGNWVAFVSIGNLSLAQITGAGTTPSVLGDADLGLTAGGAPFGGTLLPRLEFSEKLEGIAKYYRVSWRKGKTGPFTPLQDAVTRYYRHDVNNLPRWTPYVLGPKPGGDNNAVPDLYEIPFDSVAPAGIWNAPPGGIVEQFASAKFVPALAPGLSYDDAGNASGTDGSGLYQLAVELFDQHGVSVPANTISYVVPDVVDVSGNFDGVPAPASMLSGNQMILTLHIDNNHCFASLGAPNINAVPAEPCCGSLLYDANDQSAMVSMPFVAFHPHGFESPSFSLTRGTASLVSGATAPVAMSVSTLLGSNLPQGCTDPCTVAGFAETLAVYSRATDGWNTDLGLGDSDVRSFVLQPAPPKP